jgi:hypothetical protein
VKKLGEIASLGPDRRDIADGFTVSRAKTRYPALIGHKAELIRTLQVPPNRWLSPRTTPATGRPKRDIGLLWPRAGSVMIAERSRLNTQRALAVRLPEHGLANVWWPVRLHEDNEKAEKVLALWLNSTLGILSLVAHRVPTEGAWVQFKKPTLENLPILDVLGLSTSELNQLATTYESVCELELDKIANMANDPVRETIDGAFTKVLKLPSLRGLRQQLGIEPVICDHAIALEELPLEGEEQLQFELV